MHSSATPEKGVGLAMGLAIIDGEEVVLVDAEVVGVVDEVAGMRTRRRLSTSSWNGSGRLMLNHSVLVRSSVMVSRLDTDECLNNAVYLLIQQLWEQGEMVSMNFSSLTSE